MKTSGNTVLITGGSAGIGFEMARQFSEGNTVIITGRDKARMKAALSKLKNTTGVICDVSVEKDVQALVIQVFKSFSSLNVLINNAGKGNGFDITEEGVDGFQKAGEEILTNYLSVIRMNERFMPLLKLQKESAVINVSSIAVFGPRVQLATYGASKAALHAYTQALRLMLEPTSIKVFELFPPLVNTEFSKGIGGAKGMAPAAVAEQLFSSFANDVYEVYVGGAADLHARYFAKNTAGFLALNGRTE
jgi:uncharacterized oxidoreductase